MTKYLMGITLLVIGLFLISCTRNSTKYIAYELRPTELLESYNTIPPDLAIRSKCQSNPTIKIVNSEKNVQYCPFYTSLYGDNPITPNILVDSISTYMSDAFNRAGITTDQKSKKIIEVSLDKIHAKYNFNYTFSATTRLKISVPEKNYMKVYEDTDKALAPETAAAYTIHEITWKIVNDPLLQDYILCTNSITSNESASAATALEILKIKYVNGEISKDQFEKMRKDIQ